MAKRKAKSATTKGAKIAPEPLDPPAEASDPQLRREDLLRKSTLIDNVVSRSGVKKKFAKPVIEAALEALAEALVDGKDLQLPPLGKVRVLKAKDAQEGVNVLTLKLRTSKPSETSDRSDADAMVAE